MAAASTDGAGNQSAPAAAAESKPELGSSEAEAAVSDEKRWPGWPGETVYRLIVPVMKVGSIIGRKGELIKKLCEETRARVRVLEVPSGSTDRIVLISGKEEPGAELSPAMDAVLRIFKRINSISENGADALTAGLCLVRLLVASSQAIHLIGKQGAMIKSIQEGTGATIRVLTGDELPSYANTEERVVDIQGESMKVLKALEAVVAHLRKFLVDRSVIPLFEKSLSTPVVLDQKVEPWADKTHTLINTAQQATIGNDYHPPLKGDSLYDHEPHFDSPIQPSGISLYGQDPPFSGLRRTAAPFVTQITQTMQIPLSYAENIIGVGGGNIANIRRASGAVITVYEARGHSNEITVEVKGTSTQVQTAQQYIQDFMGGPQEPVPEPAGIIGYRGRDTGLHSSYLSGTSYSSSLSAHSLGGYGGSSTGFGGYGGYTY